MTSVLDTHVHVWDPRTLDYAWLDGLTALDRPFLPDDYRRGGGADRVVFVQADCRPEQSIDEARWVASLDWPELAGIVAAADLRAPDLEGALDALAQVGRVVGIRHLLQDEDVAGLTDRSLQRGLAVLAERGLTFDACIRHPQLDALVDLLATVPGGRVVLDHVGKPPIGDGLDSAAGGRWAAGIHRLAALPGTYVKLSGLPAEAMDAAAHDAHADDFLRLAVDVFGPDRAMVGSDWPVSARLGASVAPDAWAERVRTATALAGHEWEQGSSQTGARFYGLPHDV
jgi:L-fuconolactonase